MSGDREERVRQRAYEIWESENRPAGKHHDHWDRAQRELHESASSESVTTATAAPRKRGSTKRSSPSTQAEPATGRPRRAAKQTP